MADRNYGDSAASYGSVGPSSQYSPQPPKKEGIPFERSLFTDRERLPPLASQIPPPHLRATELKYLIRSLPHDVKQNVLKYTLSYFPQAIQIDAIGQPHLNFRTLSMQEFRVYEQAVMDIAGYEINTDVVAAHDAASHQPATEPPQPSARQMENTSSSAGRTQPSLPLILSPFNTARQMETPVTTVQLTRMPNDKFLPVLNSYIRLVSQAVGRSLLPERSAVCEACELEPSQEQLGAVLRIAIEMTNDKALVDNGIIPPLVGFVRELRNQLLLNTIQLVCGVLHKLSKSPEIAVIISDSGLADPLAQLVRSHAMLADVMEDALPIVANIAIVQPVKEAFLEAGLIQVLLDIMREYMFERQSLITKACFSIWTLAMCDKGLKVLGLTDCVEVVIQALFRYQYSEEVIQHTVGILSWVCRSPQCAERVRDGHVLPVIACILVANLANERLVRSLVTFVTSVYVFAKDTTYSSGIEQAVCAALRQYSSDPMAASVIQCILAMADDPQSRVKMIESSAVSLIGEVLKGGNHKAVNIACSAMKSFLKGDDNRVYRQNPLYFICEALRLFGKQEGVADVLLSTMEHFSLHPRYFLLMVDMKVLEFIKSICGPPPPNTDHAALVKRLEAGAPPPQATGPAPTPPKPPAGQASSARNART